MCFWTLHGVRVVYFRMAPGLKPPPNLKFTGIYSINANHAEWIKYFDTCHSCCNQWEVWEGTVSHISIGSRKRGTAHPFNIHRWWRRQNRATEGEISTILLWNEEFPCNQIIIAHNASYALWAIYWQKLRLCESPCCKVAIPVQNDQLCLNQTEMTIAH